jgi:hypothetical protein
MDWKIVHWAKVEKNGTAIFTDMGLNILYTPFYYKYGNFIAAKQPFLQLTSASSISFGELQEKKYTNIFLKCAMHYTFTRLMPKKVFDLYIWDKNGWEKYAESTVLQDSALTFKRIPTKRLYFLADRIRNQSHTLRPFIIFSKDSVRVL